MIAHAQEEPLDFQVRFGFDQSVHVIGRRDDFVRQGGVKVDHQAIERPFSSHFRPRMADLIDVGIAVYTADRLCRRREGIGNRYAHRWHRRMTVEIPLREPGVWKDAEVSSRLHEILAFMTEDDWEFSFTAYNEPGRVVQPYLFDTIPPQPITVALFSGGLDSLAGLCIEAKARPGDAFVLVSGWTNARLAARQDQLFEGLMGRVGRMMIPVQTPFQLIRGGHPYNDDEPTQRSRGFVHTIMGAAVALHTGSHSLACYENGVGAFNLPMTEAQIGAQNARSAHPIALAQMAELVEVVSEEAFQVRLPFVFRTKAEMCTAMWGIGMDELIPLTVSCDGFPRRVRGQPQCGKCTSCLLRRQALHSAGLSHVDRSPEYAVDVGEIGPDELPPDFQAMLHQVSKLRSALSSNEPWAPLAREFPELEETVLELETHGWSTHDTRKGILDLYQQYCSDWDRFEQRTLPIPS